MRILTIGVPTREGLYYRELLFSLQKSLAQLSRAEWKCEIIFCINGFRNEVLETRVHQVAAEFPNLGVKIIALQPNLIGKPLAMNRIKAEAEGEFILFLDDDIEVDTGTIAHALKTITTHSQTQLLGAIQITSRPGGLSRLRSMIFDILNIQHILDLFVFPDPFIIGRFMLLRKKEMPDIPAGVIKDDLYLQVLFYPNVTKIKSLVRYRGVMSFRDYYVRLFRLIGGDQQKFEGISTDQIRKYYSDPLMKRRLAMRKIIRLRPYYFFCFICYRVIKLSAYIANPMFFNTKIQGWKRTNR